MSRDLMRRLIFPSPQSTTRPCGDLLVFVGHSWAV